MVKPTAAKKIRRSWFDYIFDHSEESLPAVVKVSWQGESESRQREARGRGSKQRFSP